MQRNNKIKPKQKKSKITFAEWIKITENIIKTNSQDFNLVNRFKSIFSKQINNSEKKAVKELIQRMENKKIDFQEAQKISLLATENLQAMQKELYKLLFYILGGGILFVISVVFAIKSINLPLKITNINFFIWLSLSIVNGIIFVIGLKNRGVFQKNSLVNILLSQAGMAFAYAHSPGRGGTIFEAMHYLNLIEEKKQLNNPLNKLKLKK